MLGVKGLRSIRLSENDVNQIGLLGQKNLISLINSLHFGHFLHPHMILLSDQEAAAKARQLLRQHNPNREKLANHLGVNPESTKQNKNKALHRMIERIEKAQVLKLLRDFASYFDLPETYLIFPEAISQRLADQFPTLPKPKTESQDADGRSKLKKQRKQASNKIIQPHRV